MSPGAGNCTYNCLNEHGLFSVINHMNDTAAKNVQLWEDLTMFRQNLMMRHQWGGGGRGGHIEGIVARD